MYFNKHSRSGREFCAFPGVPGGRGETTMATTANRVSVQTSDEINRRLRLQMEERLARYETRPDQIDTRLAELLTGSGTSSEPSRRTLPHWHSRDNAGGHGGSTVAGIAGDRDGFPLPARFSGVVSASADPAQAGLPNSGRNQSGTLRVEGAQISKPIAATSSVQYASHEGRMTMVFTGPDEMVITALPRH
ncbi:hypothetical protein KGO5_02776 [Sinorhizobium sp. KGO-5]|nr:hypothetical protein KGO5_02776 [Sinorhizobium sp. KGO-5]